MGIEITLDITCNQRTIGPMSNSAAVKRHREAKLAEGYTHLQGFLPPESSAVVKAMIDQGYADTPIKACHVAILRMVQEDSQT